jgi:hypothetical protein
MKKYVLSSVLMFSCLFAAASVKLAGVISKYKISMEIVASTADKDYGVRGRYNYAGKTQSLDLRGNLYPGYVLHLEESFEGKSTGDFYLSLNEGGDWSGTWIGNGRSLEAELTVTSGDMSELEPYDLEDYHAKTSAALTGSYAYEYYWINDFQYSEEHPVLEVGFNGGVVTIAEIGQDKISFFFDLTCGPTYHGAYLEGVAVRVGPNEFEYKDSPMDDGEICEVKFTFKDRTVSLSQNSGNVACGFGARGYADGTFMKVNNVVVQSAHDGGPSIQELIGKK